MFTSLEDWLTWQSTLNPSEIELGLDRIAAVWVALGAPSLNAKVVTVAGTNGKGSSVALLNAILLAAGYRTGTYTSPHLHTYNERICLQSVPVTDQQLCQTFARIEAAREDTALTYFEYGTLAALLIFAATDLDVILLEVGLGGRLDAVNMIDADIALITPVGLDHQNWLGADIETIAAEKAGIMRAGRPVVFSGEDCPQAIIDLAYQLGTNLYQAGDAFTFVSRDTLSWDWEGPGRVLRNLPHPALRGIHQLQNAAGVLMAIEVLHPTLPVDVGAIRKGLCNVSLPGRLQYFPGKSGWLFDVAHNPQAAKVLGNALHSFPQHKKITALFAVLDDKDPQGIAVAMGQQIDRWVLPALQQSRAMAPALVQQALQQGSITAPIELSADIPSAVAAIKRTVSEDELVVVFGSFYTVGEAIACYQSKQV